MKRILFQGDSITDASRNRSDVNYRGSGYATLVSAELGADHPNEYEFINGGVAGIGIANMVSRAGSDFIGVAPDYMSLLVGINDALYEARERGEVNIEKFDTLYNMLLNEVTEALPDIKIMLFGPFILKGSATEPLYDLYRKEAEKVAECVKKTAERRSLPFVSLMDKFDAMTELAPADCWLYDGVHPTAAGHELIKREWIKLFEMIKEK